LYFRESELLEHAAEGLREMERFPNIWCIGVICDTLNPQSGDQFGADAMIELGAEVDEGITEDGIMDLEARTERWPQLVCLNDHGEDYECSRHWWFDGWNQRAMCPQRAKWPEAMAKCLEVSIWICVLGCVLFLLVRNIGSFLFSLIRPKTSTVSVTDLLNHRRRKKTIPWMMQVFFTT
jgi:hypothetical protein